MATTAMARIAATFLVATASFTVGCSSSDEELARGLKVQFAAANEGMYPGKISFAVRCSNGKKPIRLGRRKIVMTSGGREIRSLFDHRLNGLTAEDASIYLVHPTPAEVEQWLGAPGTHKITVSIGPVRSDPICITIPGLAIQSPTPEQIKTR